MEMTESEVQYSSSLAKLLYHHHRLKHPLQPITLQIALTDRCNLNCEFCSVKNREGNELHLDQIWYILGHQVFRNLHGVEITGGGEPTLHPDIKRLIGTLVLGFKLKVGLITNGIALTKALDSDTLQMLSWIRVSLNGLDYIDNIDLHGLPAGPTLGFSYVLNSKTTQSTLDKVARYAEEMVADYVRIVPDCLAPPDQLNALRPGFRLDYPRFYIQTKTMRSLTPVAPCRMGFLKPFLNTDGYFYWCSGVCLEERRFPPKYRMGRWDEITRIWGTLSPFECDFPKCFWVEHNQILEWFNTPIKHWEFV